MTQILTLTPIFHFHNNEKHHQQLAQDTDVEDDSEEETKAKTQPNPRLSQLTSSTTQSTTDNTSQDSKSNPPNHNNNNVISGILNESDVTQYVYPPAQHEKKLTLFVNRPTFTKNLDPEKMDDVSIGLPVVDITVKNANNATTQVPIGQYHSYLTDPTFIKQHHQTVNGKILQWRTNTMTLITELIHYGNFEEHELIDQFKFAKFNSFDAMQGLQKQDVLPVSVLHEQAMTQYVEGVNDSETADLVHHMSLCNTFEIIAHNKQYVNSSFRDIIIITRFDGVTKRHYGYKKKKHVRNNPNASSVAQQTTIATI